MGYSTDFYGAWTITPRLRPEHQAYLEAFSKTRRMMRDPLKTILRPDPIRQAAGLMVGPEGGYFVNEGGYKGQGRDDDVIDGNQPPSGQPGLWCKWEPNDRGDLLQWNGEEKFYDYISWLHYLIDHFLAPWGYVLKGRVDWQGEDSNDTGFIVIYNNKVFINEDPLLDRLVAEL